MDVEQDDGKQFASTDHQAGNNFYVLRDKKLIESLNDLIGNMGKENFNWEQLETLFSSIPLRDKCLLQVSLQMIKRGTMGKYSHICLPKENELSQLGATIGSLKGQNRKGEGKHLRTIHVHIKDKTGEINSKRGKVSKNEYKRGKKLNNNSSKSQSALHESSVNILSSQLEENNSIDRNQTNQSGHIILEPPHSDPNRPFRKYLRAQHKILLTRLRKRRVRAKKRGPDTFETPQRVKRKVSPSQEVVEAYRELMERLWVPDVSLTGETNGREFHGMNNEESQMLTDVGQKVKEFNEDSNLDGDKLRSDRLEIYLQQVSCDSNDPSPDEDNDKKTDLLASSSKTPSTNIKRSRKISDEIVQHKRMKDHVELSESDEKDLAVELNETVNKHNARNRSSDIENALKTTQEPSGIGASTENMDTTTDVAYSKVKETPTNLTTAQTNFSKSSKPGSNSKNDSRSNKISKNQCIASESKHFCPSDVITRLRPIRSLRFAASHELLGFVTSRSYHATAHCGQGCVTLTGFIDLLRRVSDLGLKRVVVLVRERGQMNYHWAGISLI